MWLAWLILAGVVLFFATSVLWVPLVVIWGPIIMVTVCVFNHNSISNLFLGLLSLVFKNCISLKTQSYLKYEGLNCIINGGDNT